MSGLIGKKVGMTSVFDELGRSIPVTVVEVDPGVITQIKTEEADGYEAVQIASFDKKKNRMTKALQGHFEKAGCEPKKVVSEFRGTIPEGAEVGDTLNIEDIFQVGDQVDVVGLSKGRGFTGVMKRHNFRGVGDATHGQSDVARSTGSVGGASDPSRVFQGKKMPGRSGNERVKIQNLSVAKIYSDSNLILITGSVPGSKGGILKIYNKSSIDVA
ncbi:MAG: 50S ribosomal protein L3 [Balneolaceae bacterium]